MKKLSFFHTPFFAGGRVGAYAVGANLLFWGADGPFKVHLRKPSYTDTIEKKQNTGGKYIMRKKGYAFIMTAAMLAGIMTTAGLAQSTDSNNTAVSELPKI